MNDTAFCGLMEQYERLVYTICYRLAGQDHHTAQDLAQDTFVSAYQHLDSCPQDNPKAWLARIATNKCKDHLRSAHTRRTRAMDHEALAQQSQPLFISDRRPEASPASAVPPGRPSLMTWGGLCSPRAARPQARGRPVCAVHRWASR